MNLLLFLATLSLFFTAFRNNFGYIHRCTFLHIRSGIFVFSVFLFSKVFGCSNEILQFITVFRQFQMCGGHRMLPQVCVYMGLCIIWCAVFRASPCRRNREAELSPLHAVMLRLHQIHGLCVVLPHFKIKHYVHGLRRTPFLTRRELLESDKCSERWFCSRIGKTEVG